MQLTTIAGRATHAPVRPQVTSLPRYVFANRLVQVLAYLPSFARLYWRLFRDGRVPILAKAVLVLACVYVVSPLDVVPDFIPVIGEMDDLTMVIVGLWLFVRLCPPHVVREHTDAIVARSRARG
jgi:uncharacterized membrane protein YkvA (DUF1232 family)